MNQNYYVVSVYGYKKATLLMLEGNTKERCIRAVKWQQHGQSDVSVRDYICKPHDTKRGVFVRVDNGLLFEVSRMAWTEEAFEAALDAIWGASK